MAPRIRLIQPTDDVALADLHARNRRGAFQSCSMGYWLSQDRTGRGYATQAVNTAVDLAFTELALHRVQAATLVSNSASQNVLSRAGFERIGLAPRYLRIAGRWQDHLLFQRVSGDAPT